MARGLFGCPRRPHVTPAQLNLAIQVVGESVCVPSITIPQVRVRYFEWYVRIRLPKTLKISMDVALAKLGQEATY